MIAKYIQDFKSFGDINWKDTKNVMIWTLNRACLLLATAGADIMVVDCTSYIFHHGSHLKLAITWPNDASAYTINEVTMQIVTCYRSKTGVDGNLLGEREVKLE